MNPNGLKGMLQTILDIFGPEWGPIIVVLLGVVIFKTIFFNPQHPQYLLPRTQYQQEQYNQQSNGCGSMIILGLVFVVFMGSCGQ